MHLEPGSPAAQHTEAAPSTAPAASDANPSVPVSAGPSTLDGARLRDGDLVLVTRHDGSVESRVRRWGVWHADVEQPGDRAWSDAELLAAIADLAGAVGKVGEIGQIGQGARSERGDQVRYIPRQAAAASTSGRRRVVVTGLGAITPLGYGVPELWHGLLEGRCAIRELTDEEFADHPARIAGTVETDPAELLPRVQARRMNRSAQFAVLAAREAWQDAGFDPAGTAQSGLDPERVGVSVGTIIGGTPVMIEGDRKLREKGLRAVPALTAPMTVPSQASSQISLDLHITGEARTVVSACASGTEAIGAAIDRIRHGYLDVAVAGGAEAVITPAVMASFSSMRALSTRNDEPGRASRPFAADRDGFVNGEGAGLLVLESEEHARARGARIYCEAAGSGLSADAHHIAAPDPTGSGVASAVRRAIRDAGAHAVDVVHVNAHATATVEGDLAEAKALRAVLGEGSVPVTALKGNFGHLQGAAGGVEAVATVLTLHHGVIPPTIGCDTLDEAIALDVVTSAPRPLPARGDLALSNSFGFGGHNAVLALRRCA
ncbi:beta-ketoacyl-[acyl-carrier-protein] synthase family protein [Streptomyces indicus]|nr:beta-ketoacyl-[acyl-carrier-protein] synthase family protein [Streptomyces indicus]